MPLCYRCGAPAAEEAEFCPQCGTRLTSRNRSLDLLQIFGATGLILSTLMIGAGGSCFFLYSLFSYAGGSGSANPATLAIGPGLMAVAPLFFFGFIKLVSSSPPRPVWLFILTVFGMVIPAFGAYVVLRDILDATDFRIGFSPAPSGSGTGQSAIVILSALVALSVLIMVSANKFFKRK